MDQYTRFIIKVMTIPTNVVSSVDYYNRFSKNICDAFGKDQSGKSCTNDQIICIKLHTLQWHSFCQPEVVSTH